MEKRIWALIYGTSMIVVAGIAIGMDRTCGLRYSDMKWMMILVTMLDFSTFYPRAKRTPSICSLIKTYGW